MALEVYRASAPSRARTSFLALAEPLLIPLLYGVPARWVNQVFEGIVKNMLVNNGHRATVESVPNTELEAAIDGKEKGKLDEVKKSMSDEVKMR